MATPFFYAELAPALKDRIKAEGVGLERLTVVPGSQDDLKATFTAITRFSCGPLPAPVPLEEYHFHSD